MARVRMLVKNLGTILIQRDDRLLKLILNCCIEGLKVMFKGCSNGVWVV